jgi:hypothetical protein
MKKLFKGVLALVVLLGMLNSVASAGDVFNSAAGDPDSPVLHNSGVVPLSFSRFGCGMNGC